MNRRALGKNGISVRLCGLFDGLTSKFLSCSLPSDAYYTQETYEQMRTVDDIPSLRMLRVPEGRYKCARKNARITRNRNSPGDEPDVPSGHESYSGGSQPPLPSPHYVHQDTSVQWPDGPARLLAPLEYLEAIPPRIRNAVDDQQLRSFRYVTAL